MKTIKANFTEAKVNDTNYVGVAVNNAIINTVKKEEIRKKYKEISTSTIDAVLNKHKEYIRNTMGMYQDKQAIFIGEDLTHYDFSGKDLSNVHFLFCDLTGVDFRNCILDYVKFNESTLRRAYFDNATGLSTEFTNSCMRACSFIGAKFEYGDFYKTDFTEADLRKSIFDNCKCGETIFNNTDLSEVLFKECELKAEVNFAKMYETKFEKTKTDHIVLNDIQREEVVIKDE